MVMKDLKIQSHPSKSSSPPPSSSSSSKKKYKGVRMRSWGSWVSEIRAPNQKTRIWLGSYSTAEAAARAYDAALLILKGPTANFNFPATTVKIPSPAASSPMSPKSIQKMAAAAAAETSAHFSPPPSMSSSFESSTSSACNNYFQDDDMAFAFNNSSTSAFDDLSWYQFDSPKYFDTMSMNGAFFDPAVNYIEEAYVEDDIRLWSFN